MGEHRPGPVCISSCSPRPSLLDALGLSDGSHQRAGLSCWPGRNLILGGFCSLNPCTVYPVLAKSVERSRKPFSGSLGDGTARAFVGSSALISDGLKCSYKMRGDLLLVHLGRVGFAKEDGPAGLDSANRQCSRDLKLCCCQDLLQWRGPCAFH